MSGVVVDGVQWEHCCEYGTFVKLSNLGYLPPSAEFPHGRDLCIACSNKAENLQNVVPAADWDAIYA